MKTFKTLLMATTVLGLGAATAAHADIVVNTNTGAVVGTTADVDVNTKTDVKTDKVINADGSTTTTTTKTTYYTYDVNQNKTLDNDEFRTYTYTAVDMNRDGKIDSNEWNRYTNVWYTPVDMTYDTSRTFVGYDVDGDGFIETEEYAKAYDNKLYTAWDADGDGVIGLNEYNNMTTKTTYYMYDINNDNMLDNDEFRTYTYTAIDADRDGMIDNTEWDTYTTTWYEPLDVKYDTSRTFVGYDLNGNGYIESDEYAKAYDPSLYSAWDANANGTVEFDEYSTVTTTYHDHDNDGVYEWITVQ